ncbi:MAG: cytochrome ubiquinol oxidase subunit I [Deltaproteobacteria bacterium]|nr:cytochrome ubiquinol oxidase subunit I [Deltaproteobacteria bacterium]
MDALWLSRLQFGLTVGFHFIFPSISMGLAWLLVIFEGLAWWRRDEVWERCARFFGKLFALTFGAGVATGIVMEFQFGTNWAAYSRFVGDIFGAPLAAEVVFAFFLESSFLGLYLFGRGRISRAALWLSVLVVAIGASVSAFWILAANSWQQTPAGFRLEAGRAVLSSFSDAILNPSTWQRFFHTLTASLVAGAFFSGGISAWLVLKERGVDAARRALGISLALGLAASLASVYPTGHVHASQVARTQPAKFAAIEGVYESTARAPMVLFAVPTTRPPELHAVVEIPGLLSWLTFGDADASVRGLDSFPPDEVPQGAELWLAFVSFHTMVALGMYFIALTGLGLLLLWRRRLWRARWYLRLLALSTPLPVAACQLGWIAAEVGRQPWIVQGLLKTGQAASDSVSAGEVLFSILLFGVLYALLGAAWLYLLFSKIRSGPGSAEVSQ